MVDISIESFPAIDPRSAERKHPQVDSGAPRGTWFPLWWSMMRKKTASEDRLGTISGHLVAAVAVGN